MFIGEETQKLRNNNMTVIRIHLCCGTLAAEFRCRQNMAPLKSAALGFADKDLLHLSSFKIRIMIVKGLWVVWSLLLLQGSSSVCFIKASESSMFNDEQSTAF